MLNIIVGVLAIIGLLTIILIIAGMKFKDSAAGDPLEWPEDLRVREFPKLPAS